ncbi:MAG: hypothetical protein ACRDD8_05305 [Bacteroidales bacterium]
MDDSAVAGLKLSFFSHVTGGGTSEGKPNATLVHANAAEGRKASGIIYDASPRDQYGNGNNWRHNNRLYPYGMRQDLALALIKTGVIEISDSEVTKHQQFAVINEMVLPKELKLLQKVQIEDAIYFVRDIDGTNVHLVDASGTAKTEGLTLASQTKVLRVGQMDDPVFLAGWTEDPQKGSTIDASAIPFPFVTWNTGQIVGHIESPIAVRFDLNADPYLDVIESGVALLEASEEQREFEVASYEAGYKRDYTNYWEKTSEHTPVAIAKYNGKK